MSSEAGQDVMGENQYTGKRYYGKYRGKVVLNVDPLLKGRVRAVVPSVTAFVPSTWIEPASPFAGLNVGLFVVPPLNASVWVEFIEGDPRYPVWTGAYWDEKDMAAIPPESRPFIKPGQVMVRTITTAVTMDDVPIPTITIETMDGKKIMVTSTGVAIGLGPPSVGGVTSGITVDAAGNITITGTKITILAPNVSINGP